mmetsp:Transcript_37444/g.33550  ORF Transcript_37444/g.33550 Transcript_37444/m.33550 type:complete len:272 (-) Transcript_37444:808-1623(-)
MGLCYMQLDEPKRVIEYTSRVLELSGINQDIIIKAYIRRGMAYEKIEKNVLALQDFEAVKHIQPGNKQASDGLHRIHNAMQNDPDLKKNVEKMREEVKNAAANTESPKEAEKVEKSAPKPDISTLDIEKLEKIKATGNDAFKKKTFVEAISNFQQVIDAIDPFIDDLSGLPVDKQEAVKKLYLAVLSNSSMAAFNSDDITGSLDFSNKALRIDPKHAKCLYRKALCETKIGEFYESRKPKEGQTLVDLKKEQLSHYQSARAILEDILKSDP